MPEYKKQGWYGNKGRQDKAGGAEKSQTEHTAEKNCFSRQMTACFPPLVDTDYNKESSHGKINACGVKWKKLSDEAPATEPATQ